MYDWMQLDLLLSYLQNINTWTLVSQVSRLPFIKPVRGQEAVLGLVVLKIGLKKFNFQIGMSIFLENGYRFLLF